MHLESATQVTYTKESMCILWRTLMDRLWFDRYYITTQEKVLQQALLFCTPAANNLDLRFIDQLVSIDLDKKINEDLNSQRISALAKESSHDWLCSNTIVSKTLMATCFFNPFEYVLSKCSTWSVILRTKAVFWRAGK